MRMEVQHRSRSGIAPAAVQFKALSRQRAGKLAARGTGEAGRGRTPRRARGAPTRGGARSLGARGNG